MIISGFQMDQHVLVFPLVLIIRLSSVSKYGKKKSSKETVMPGKLLNTGPYMYLMLVYQLNFVVTLI